MPTRQTWSVVNPTEYPSCKTEPPVRRIDVKAVTLLFLKNVKECCLGSNHVQEFAFCQKEKYVNIQTLKVTVSTPLAKKRGSCTIDLFICQCYVENESIARFDSIPDRNTKPDEFYRWIIHVYNVNTS